MDGFVTTRPLLTAGLAVFVVSAPCLSLRAQDTPSFRAGTTLVEFTIVALDDKGNPIVDLAIEDLVIVEDGQSRDIAFFRFDGAPAPAAPVQLPPDHFTNRFESSGNAARHIAAIVVDAMNMPPVKKTFLFTQATVRNQIITYLDRVPPRSRVGVFRIGREVLDVLHDFTDDVQSLKASVAKMDLVMPELDPTTGYRPDDFAKSGASGSPEAAQGRALALAADAKNTAAAGDLVQIRRLDLTLPALEAVGNHLAGFPGRKNIVWVGNGMPIRNAPSRARATRDYEARMRATAERLATQGVAVYPVSSSLADEPVKESLNLFADVTGGRVTLTMNDPIEGLRTTALDQRATYSLAFYAVAPPDDRWRRVTVQTRRPNVQLRHRQGYRAEAAAQQSVEWGEEQWRAALGNPLGSSLIRLDADFRRTVEPNTYDLRMNIALDDLHYRADGGAAAAQIEVAIAEKIGDGNFAFRVERGALGAPPEQGADATAAYAKRLQLRPDTVTVRIIVRDRFTGRHGALDFPLSRR
jgi:VWFA-related protein